jgi:hypothetical protein
MDSQSFEQAMQTLVGVGFNFPKKIDPDVWAEALKLFSGEVLKRAVSELGRTQRNFPTLAEVANKCRDMSMSQEGQSFQRPNKSCPMCDGTGYVDVLTEEYFRGNTVAHCPCKSGYDTSGERMVVLSGPGIIKVMATDDTYRVAAKFGYLRYAGGKFVKIV